MSDRYLLLDEKDFECLVRGGVVHWDNIHIALKDIGFDRMNHAIEKSIEGINIGRDHNREG